ncbi:MAG: hypothetical protein NVSMB22_09290 [Chloroflexota bacterium]
MAHLVADLDKMFRSELIAEHDALTPRVEMSVGYYLDAIRRHDAKCEAMRIENMTSTIKNLTWAIIGCTAVMTVLTAMILWATLYH